MQKVSIIGVGRVGGAVALALSKSGYEISELVTRTLKNAEEIAVEITPTPKIKSAHEIDETDADIVFITTQDSEIGSVVRKLTEYKPRKKTFVFHTSGSISSEILEDLSVKGYCVGSIHPLVSISDSKLGVERFRDAYFCVEGEEEAVVLAEEIVEQLGGKFFTIDTKKKPLYHASAVVACGHLVALLDTAFRMFSKCGVTKEESKKILMPLVKSTISNLENQTSSEALTGTFDRVDIETFERHMEALNREVERDDIGVYLRLGMQSLKLVDEDRGNSDRKRILNQKLDEQEIELRKTENG